MEIKIKYHNKNLTEIKEIPQGDWIDLRAAETVELKQFEYRKISLGISMEIPQGYEAHVAPRSGTYENWGIIQTNSVAVIDGKYCGDNDVWKYPALAMRDTIINENDRICQFRIIEKQPKIDFVKVENMNNADRGGFGSTGIN